MSKIKFKHTQEDVLTENPENTSENSSVTKFNLEVVDRDGKEVIKAEIEGHGGDLINMLASAAIEREEVFVMLTEATKKVALERAFRGLKDIFNKEDEGEK